MNTRVFLFACLLLLNQVPLPREGVHLITTFMSFCRDATQICKNATLNYRTTGTAYLLPKSYENYRVYSMLMHLAGKVQNVTLATGPKHVAFLINGSRGGITTKGKVIQVSHSISLSLVTVALRQRRDVNDIWQNRWEKFLATHTILTLTHTYNLK
jgi:hypothetical protein